MATSGTVTFRPTGATIIKTALESLGATDPNNTNHPTTIQSTAALVILNMLVKEWEAFGLQLWERKWGVIIPRVGRTMYHLGSPGPNSSGDYCSSSVPLGGQFLYTTLSADAALSATSVTLTAVTSHILNQSVSSFTPTTNDIIMVANNSKTFELSFVSGAPSGNVISPISALSVAADAGNSVYVVRPTLYMSRPLRILDAFIRTTNSDQDRHVNIVSRDKFNRFSSKKSQSSPTHIYYDPQTSTGHLYVYPTFSTLDELLFVEYQRAIEDFATTSNDFDMPQEWANALTWNLAWRLSPSYEVSQTKYNQVKELALYSLDLLKGWDQEEGSIFIQPGDFNG